MKIYIISGKSGSGKTRVGRIIKDYYFNLDKKCIMTEFSKYLKLYAKEIIGWDYHDPKPRAFLQTIGSEIRNDNELFLVNRMLEDIRIYEKHADVLVISDTRLPQEIESLKSKFNDVISIYVKNEFGPSKLSIEEQKDITENGFPSDYPFDYVIINDTEDTLDDKVINIIKEID